ncbi:oxidoreductase [Pontibacillus halophilus JSM 076056 = DSM 19796]|uniref:Oxidoreductase n=1 Tax=Pontibacillus halophilus JSM 076056 = DSM 19796 TaxID=1385510 RepID=A0A0A5GLL0_9BACI|nr:Gfo/Idh/MocA family oxidoreductase [Pontibacillus halophilus]KGX92015.1 oxidoreductase [Pontibacillus halophilus JSM 076056 = DSM 19796]
MNRVAVIGGGGIAEDHLRALQAHPAFHPVAVVEIREERARLLENVFDLAAYESINEMLLTEKPYMAIIALPHYLHKEASLLCIEHGVHLLIEKPMALSVKDCLDIQNAAQEQNVAIMVAHTQHYLSENLAACERIGRGDLGELLMVHEERYIDYFHQERPSWFLSKELAGGGIVMNLGSHSIDKVQWLTGQSFQYVKATCTFQEQIQGCDVEGSGFLYFETNHGVPVSISLSGYEQGQRQRTELVYRKGRVVIEMGKGATLIKQGGEEESLQYRKDSYSPLYRQLEDFHGYLTNGGSLTCDGPYATSVVHAVECAYRSHSKKRMIDLINTEPL